MNRKLVRIAWISWLVLIVLGGATWGETAGASAYRGDDYHFAQIEKIRKSSKEAQYTSTTLNILDHAEQIIKNTRDTENRDRAYMLYIFHALDLSGDLFSKAHSKYYDWGMHGGHQVENSLRIFQAFSSFYALTENREAAMKFCNYYLAMADMHPEAVKNNERYSIQITKADLLIESLETDKALDVVSGAVEELVAKEKNKNHDFLYPLVQALISYKKAKKVGLFKDQLLTWCQRHPVLKKDADRILLELPSYEKAKNDYCAPVGVSLLHYAFARREMATSPDPESWIPIILQTIESVLDVEGSKYTNYGVLFGEKIEDFKGIGKLETYRKALIEWRQRYPFAREPIDKSLEQIDTLLRLGSGDR